MKIIKPYAEIMTSDFGVDPLRKIELVGRTCYKSTDKITDVSAIKFVANLIKAGHEAMLEHDSFCFMLPFDEWNWLKEKTSEMMTHLKENGEEFISHLRFTNVNRCLVSGNIRAWRDFFKECTHQIGFIPKFMQNFILSNPVLFPEFQDGVDFRTIFNDDIYQISRKGLIGLTEFMIHCDVTAKFVVDRGISHEIVRHRPASFAQESTRYCNYSKDKFDEEITVIQPCFFEGNPYHGYSGGLLDIWEESCESAEYSYFKLLENGATPEQARDVLPTSTKTEVIMTATLGEWRHFFNLRACNSTGKAHPQMLEVAQPLLTEFQKEFEDQKIFADMKMKKG